MTVTERMLNLPRGPMRVREYGEGPTLIWTHGIFHPIDVDDHSTLGHVLNEITGYRVVRYDTRGHGRTPAAELVAQHRWDSLADDLLALADALSLDRFIAGGISMGAAIALHAAVAAENRVAGLVLLAPPTGWETRPPQLQGYLDLAALPGPGAVAAKVQRDLEQDFGEQAIPKALRVMIDGLRAAEPRGLERVLRGAAESDLPPRSAVSALSTKALVMPWQGDSGHPYETAEAIAACLKHAQLRVVNGFEDAAGIAAGIRDFLAECRPMFG